MIPYHDLERHWSSNGNLRVPRRLPRYWTLSTPSDWRDVFRATAWLVVRAVAMVGVVVVLLALAAGRHVA